MEFYLKLIINTSNKKGFLSIENMYYCGNDTVNKITRFKREKKYIFKYRKLNSHTQGDKKKNKYSNLKKSPQIAQVHRNGFMFHFLIRKIYFIFPIVNLKQPQILSPYLKRCSNF